MSKIYSTTPPIQKKRIPWIDWAKSMGIFLVVLGHMRVLHGKPLIYMFHMAFFFILSGFLYKRHSFSKEIVKSSKSLLIPYLCYNIILLVIAYSVGDFETGMLRKILLCNYELFPVRYFSPLWFLISLFIMRIACSLIKDTHYYLIAYISLLTSAILFYTHLLPLDKENDYFQWATTLICFPSYIFGYLMNKKNMLEIPDKIQSPIVRNTFIFLLLVVLAIAGKFNGRVNVFTCAVGKDIMLYYAISTIMSFLIIYIVSKLFNFTNKYIEIISNGTILILSLHVAMIDGISFGFNMNSMLSILLGIVIMVLCVMLIFISLNFFPFLLGKQSKQQL